MINEHPLSRWRPKLASESSSCCFWPKGAYVESPRKTEANGDHQLRGGM